MARLVSIGADGARGGWLTACSYQADSDNSEAARTTTLSLHPSFESLVALRTGTDAVMAVDVPMGLLGAMAPRPCDAAARRLLKGRASTVFAPPSRPLLNAETYADARSYIEELRKHDPAAAGLSAQAFGIVPKVREVDQWLRENPGAQAWLYECHPELSFYAMASGVLANKRSPHGQVDRLRHVSEEFPDAPTVISGSRFRAKDAELADVLDAYAALSSASHVRAGDFEELGGETDSAGLVMRIVF